MSPQPSIDNAYSAIDSRLLDLTAHLDYNVAERVRQLVAADAVAHRVIDAEQRAQLAEDVAAELRRQMRARDRQLEQLREDVAGAADALGRWNGEDGSLVVDAVARNLRRSLGPRWASTS